MVSATQADPDGAGRFGAFRCSLARALAISTQQGRSSAGAAQRPLDPLSLLVHFRLLRPGADLQAVGGDLDVIPLQVEELGPP